MLRHAVYSVEAPPSLRTLPAVDMLRQIWVHNDLAHENGGVTWRDAHNIPPAARFISSPYDLDAHDARKYRIRWGGYNVHLTDTCDDVTPPLITPVLTTTAPVDTSKATASIHAALASKDLLPRCHIVDAGDVDAERLAVSQRDYALDLCGTVRGSVRWQAHTEGALELSRFVIDGERQQVTCPAAHTNLSWPPAVDNRDHDVIKDLLDEGIVTRADLRRSSDTVIARLIEDAERAMNHHRLYPHPTKHKSTLMGTKAEWQKRAETSLFRSKRARHLATLLGIRRMFQKQGLDPSISMGVWKKAFESARFRQAISQLVRCVKAERVGINMMDITVCGAVAPYNLLLGGKLVCLLLCSPEVVKKYTARYNEQMSLIASSMRGAAVTRGAQLVLLCTTSLYGSSLSQYSRVKAPAELLGGRKGEKVAYEVVGMSEGFGSFHFSKEMLRLMAMLLGRANRARKVSSIFGEGVNPLMRKIREALAQLGLPDNLLQHGSKRVVYGVPLASNFREVLLGLADVAHYIVPQTKEKLRTEVLADYWRQRWLLRRLDKPGILEEVAKHTMVYPIRHGAQVQLPREQEETMSLWDIMP